MRGPSATSFDLEAVDGRARAGRLDTRRGAVPTPAFMPVGTVGTVKSLSPDELAAAGARIVLGNAYHLYLRPGLEVLEHFGGLHDFMDWPGPILTDSGGFQVFSLARINQIDDDGVTFQSHIDGSTHRLTPERSIEIQTTIGADIQMAFDECPPGEASREMARAAVERSLVWLERCRDRHGQLSGSGGGHREPGALFPIFQGASYEDLRLESLERSLALADWPGIGIGGLSVGEPRDVMLRILDVCEPHLPVVLPRYLMGVGYPEDLLDAIGRGVDLFDCVAPTRNGRNGSAFTRDGRVNVRNARFKTDPRPLDPECQCPCCTRHARGYLRHLFIADELYGLRLLSLHNVHFLLRLTSDARAAIVRGDFERWADEWLRRYRGSSPVPDSET